MIYSPAGRLDDPLFSDWKLQTVLDGAFKLTWCMWTRLKNEHTVLCYPRGETSFFSSLKEFERV